jgi:hypothetical protein
MGFLLLFFIVPSSITAQSAMPTGTVLGRMLMIESDLNPKKVRGSTFSIDVDNREYWITAKHIITGAEKAPFGPIKSTSVTLQVESPAGPTQQWLPITFSVIDTSDDNVDIVVLAKPQTPLMDSPPNVTPDSTGAIFGGDCEFLGFPYGGGWLGYFSEQGKSYWLPYIKHCVVSALQREPITIWILDGINNDGFSGGPVIFGTGSTQKIMAVISGYHLEPSAVIPIPKDSDNGSKTPPEPQPPPTEMVNVNSGFIIAYDIKYALDAIRKNPIGPLRPNKAVSPN